MAREPGEIYGPVFARYKTITDARKKLRNLEKKGDLNSGDEYFALAHACQYEEPESRSMILTALGRSRCKDKSGEYFVEAGVRGTPEGFLGAAQFIGQGDQAYIYAQVAYQLAGNDAALRSEALDAIARLRSGLGNVAALDAQAVQLATRLVAEGAYPGLRAAATTVDVENRLPTLSWLDFKNPARCTWSDAAVRVFETATGFDENRMYGTIPATTRVPGIEQPVTSRVTRPDQSVPSMVVYYLDFKGTWNGLTVLGLTNTFLEESHGVHGTGIRFAEPVSTVAERLTRAGFVVNPAGGHREQVDARDRDGNIDGVTTYLGRKNGETVFLCDEIFYASYGG